ncbi:hypothetical protein SAMN04487983_100368 [Streptomyces sp. yr375]|uniref:hypothetical protein n=1 Tax=Streptomyces sp. yr375 TaxID=1761906 RepID=UPI0008AD393B|nr:hypothetical protein [Streptomyces sp. yr375]SEQ10207.1 hypothetical protein SAMN04487983_100368 [Streptomyces sp. yr375]
MPMSFTRRRYRTAAAVGSGLLAIAATYVVIQTSADAADVPTRPDRAAVQPEAAAPRTPSATAASSGAPGVLAATPTTAPSAPPKTQQPAPSRSQTADIPLTGTQVAATALPDQKEKRWRPISAPVTQPLDRAFGLNECVSVPGAVDWQQQGFISAQSTPAVQDTLSFPDEAAARAAYLGVLDAMKGCAEKSRALQKEYKLPEDAVVRQTADTRSGTAWMRRWTGVQGFSAPGDQTNHVYAVQHGQVLALLHFDEWDAKAAPSYDLSGDAAVLRTLGAQLAG